jgi:hypothetical protein
VKFKNSESFTEVDDEEHEAGMSVSLSDGGCDECSAPEVYHLQLQILQGKQRIKVESWVECYCDSSRGHREVTKCEESMCYAVKMSTDKSTGSKDKESSPSEDNI